MNKRQIAIVFITGVLIAAVFFLTTVISSDRSVKFSIIIPLFMSLPFLLVAGIMIYFSGDR